MLWAIVSEGDDSGGGSQTGKGPRREAGSQLERAEFSAKRSAMAVAMVVLKRMLPHSENAVSVVMTALLCWLWRVEIT